MTRMRTRIRTTVLSIPLFLFTIPLLSMTLIGCDSPATAPRATANPPVGVPSEASSKIITTSIAGNVAILDTVAALRALPTASLDSKSIYVLMGYLARGDSSAGNLNWVPTSAAADDGIFTFKPTAVTGNGRFVRIESGTFDARKGGLRMNGTASQFAKLSQIYTACNIHGGIDKLWLGPGTLDIRDGGTLVPGTTAGFSGSGASRSIGLFGAGRLATRIVGNARGTLAQQFGIMSQLQEQDTVAYQSHSWVQDLSNGAGTTTFVGVTNTGTLAVGDWVFCRLGADPTDQGEEYERLITRITAISGSNVTVSNPVRVVIPQFGSTINVNRLWNKHDMLKITALFNGFEMADLSLDNVLVSANTTMGTYLHDIHIPYGTLTFSMVQDENTVLERISADVITGINVGTGANAHLGWFYQGWGHINTILRDINIHLLDGVNLFAYESQSRSMSLDNIQVNLNSLQSPIGTAPISVNVGGLDGARFGNVSLTGLGSTMFDRNATIGNLSVMGGDTVDPYLDVFVQAWQITESLFIKGKSYKQIRRAPTMLIPIPPGSIIATPFPVKGIPRRVRIRPSTLTGVTYLAQGAIPPAPLPVIETDIRTFLVAGQFSEPNHSTQLGVNYPGGGRADSHFLKIVTDASTPPGHYVEVESEFWVADDSLSTQPAEKIAGAGAPASNAQFISQEYYDVTNKKTYVSVTVGGGAADWILLGP